MTTIPKEVKVKNVKRFIEGHERQHVATCEQILDWFGEAPKLRAILWAALREQQVIARRVAEGDNDRYDPPEPTPTPEPKAPCIKDEKELPRELPPMTVVVGLCPRCGSKCVGEPQPSCSKKRSALVFYKECTACPHYEEVWRVGNKYKTFDEGG